MAQLASQVDVISRPAPAPARKSASISMIGCIESGVLEAQTLRMVESLRLFGGRYANCELFLAQPRPNAPLLASTRSKLRDLHVIFLDTPYLKQYRWHHYMNKLHAMLWAERMMSTDTVAWVDADLIFAAPPTELDLQPDEDIAAQPEMGVVGTTGAGDPFDPYWSRAAALFGLTVDDLPWVITPCNKRIRFYLNAGIFAFRRSCNFAQHYFHDAEKFLRSNVARHYTELHLMDQVVMSMTIIRRRLAWRAITPHGNYHTSRATFSANARPERMRGASVLHYHDTLYPETWDAMLECIRVAQPHIYRWLRTQSPITVTGPVHYKAIREAYRLTRGLHRRVYCKLQGVYKPPQRAVPVT